MQKRATTTSTTVRRPAGMQAMGQSIYQQIRQLVLELAAPRSVRPS